MARLIEIQTYNPYAEKYGVRRVPLHLRQQAPIPIGTPFLVHAPTGRIIEESLSFSLSIADKPIRHETGKAPVLTAQTYHYPMRGLTEVAARERVPLRHLDGDVFDLWLSERMSDATLKRGTIVAGIGVAKLWTDHLSDRFGYSFDVDFDVLKARTWGFDSLYDGVGNLRDTSSVDASRAYMMRTLDSAGWSKIEALSGPVPKRWKKGGPSSRPRLAHLFGIEGGCRLMEATAGIHADAIMAVRVDDPAREYPFDLRTSKRVDGRTILLPGDVILEAQDYVGGERAACIKAAKDLADPDWSEPLELLVNGLSSGQHVGRAVAPSSVQRDLRSIQERAGMVEPISVVGRDGRTRLVDRVAHCFHDLRHTNARGHYDIAIARGLGFERAVEIVQERLGHASRTTTERIYLFRDKRLSAKASDLLVTRVRDFGRALSFDA